MSLDQDLLEIIRCPKCHGRVLERATPEPALVCGECKLLYAIVDDIPNFLIDEAAAVE
jgi:uncharacterized protein YbaR (Trm112 family)